MTIAELEEMEKVKKQQLCSLLDEIKREKLNVRICVDSEYLKAAHEYDPDIPKSIDALYISGTVVLFFKEGEFRNIIGGDTFQIMMYTPKGTETHWFTTPIVIQNIDDIKQMYANEEGFEEHMKLLQESDIFGDKILPKNKEFIDKFLKSTKEEKGAKNNGR